MIKPSPLHQKIGIYIGDDMKITCDYIYILSSISYVCIYIYIYYISVW